MKLSPAWLLCLLPLSSMALAAPEPLLKVVVASPALADNGNSNTCTLDGNGQVSIEHTVKLSPSGPSLKSKEIRAANLNVNGIKTVIAVAAQGKITGTPPVVGGFKHQYFAFQNTKKIFLLDKVAGDGYGLFNDSPAVEPLTKFIDSVCGDLSFVAYQDSARAKFADVILDTAGVKAAVEVCAQTNGGLYACDGTPFGDSTVHAALAYVNEKIAATPDAKTASVTIINSGPTSVTITATAVTTGGLNGETYVLSGAYVAGMVKWTKDAASTCIAASLC